MSGLFDEAEFNKMVTEERKALLNLTRMRMKKVSEDDVEDVLQEALCAAWKNRHNMTDEGATRAYVKGTITNLARNRFCSLISNRKKMAVIPEEETFSGHNDNSRELQRTPKELQVRETAESIIMDREAPSLAKETLDNILSRISPVYRQHFIEWQRRGFVNHTHGEACSMSRAMVKIRKLLKTDGVGRRGRKVNVSCEMRDAA